MLALYKKIITQPLGQLDCSTGKVFKLAFFYALKTAAVAVVVLGLYLIITGFFGKTGYFATLRGSFSNFELVRSLICFVITLALNLLLFFIVSGVLWKRANDFKDNEFNGVSFLLPRLIRLIGEATCCIPAIASTISFIAIVLAAIPYAPVEGLIGLTGGLSTALINNFIGNTFSAIFVQNFQDYIALVFKGGVLGLFNGFALSFIILLGTYLIADLFEIIIYFFIREKRNIKV